MMGAVRSLRMGIWRGISRMSLGKLLVILAMNALVVWLVWPADDELDVSHLSGYSSHR